MPALAASVGADMIEIDLRPTGDGEPLLIHDATLHRTSNASGVVADMDAIEIARVDAGSWFEPAFAGTPMPLLGEVLALMKRRPGLDLLLELKAPWDQQSLVRVLTQIGDAGLGERVLVQSAAVNLLQMVRELAPDLRRGYLTSTYDAQVRDLCADLGVVACNPRFSLLLEQPDVLAEIHAAGQQVMAWTANEPSEWASLVDLGVDGIITDRPDRLAGWLAAHNR